MEISIANEHGCLDAGHTEIVARDGHSLAEVNIALCEDGRYRHGVSLTYSYGGFGGPISADKDGYADVGAAKTAGMEELLRRWPMAFPSEPQSVHDELAFMREEIEGQLCQPSLF